MTHRPHILDQTKEIVALYLGKDCRPISTKDIVIRLNLSSAWVVYEALRRGRILGLVPRRTKIHQNPPRAF